MKQMDCMLPCVCSVIGSFNRRRHRERHKFAYLMSKNNSFCTPCTCIFHFCSFLSRSRQVCDVKWPNFKFSKKREHTTANLNFLCLLVHRSSWFIYWIVLLVLWRWTSWNNDVKVSKIWICNIERRFLWRRRLRSKAPWHVAVSGRVKWLCACVMCWPLRVAAMVCSACRK